MEASRALGHRNAPDALSAAASEFMRAREQLLAASDDPCDLPLYRLRDVALATMDLARELLVAAGVDVAGDTSSIKAAMIELAGNDGEVVMALDTLSGLTNAHLFHFLSSPPEQVLETGRSASIVIAGFLDALLGDLYSPKGGGAR